MKKQFLFTIFVLSLSWGCWAQQPQEKNILLPENQKQHNPFDRFTFGGGIGGSIGSSQWGVSLAPRIGYKITDNLEAAFSVNYSFQSGNNVKYHTWGLGPSLNYYIYRNFFVKAAYTHYFIKEIWKRTRDTYSYKEDALYLGGGYMQHLGGRSYLRLGLSYNVLYDKNKSIFSSGLSPEVGIVIGL